MGLPTLQLWHQTNKDHKLQGQPIAFLCTEVHTVGSMSGGQGPIASSTRQFSSQGRRNSEGQLCRSSLLGQPWKAVRLESQLDLASTVIPLGPS